jgi:hypothetical protein
MIWWRGNGLWIGFLASIPAVAAGKLGAAHVAMAYAASAALIYILRESIGAESALFSVSTRFWPPLLIVVALVVQFSPAKQTVGSNVPRAMADARADLPRMLNPQIRIDRADQDGNTLNFHVTSLAPFDSDGTQQAAFAKDARKLYCDDSKALWQAKFNVTFTLSVPPRTLNDRVATRTLSLHPNDCGSAAG